MYKYNAIPVHTGTSDFILIIHLGAVQANISSIYLWEIYGKYQSRDHIFEAFYIFISEL